MDASEAIGLPQASDMGQDMTEQPLAKSFALPLRMNIIFEIEARRVPVLRLELRPSDDRRPSVLGHQANKTPISETFALRFALLFRRRRMLRKDGVADLCHNFIIARLKLSGQSALLYRLHQRTTIPKAFHPFVRLPSPVGTFGERSG